MYQKAVVVYFDILGFKESVYKSPSNSEEFGKIKNLFLVINEEKRRYNNNVTCKQVIHASDSIWISHIQNDGNDIIIPNEQAKDVLREMINKYKNNPNERISSKYLWLEKTYF